MLRRTRGVRVAVAVATLSVAALGVAAPAAADPTGRIVGIEETETGLQVLFVGNDLPEGASIDPGSVRVDVGGEPLEADASLLTEDAEPVRRTVMLVLDTSGSMDGAGIEGAKLAARTFLDSLPAGVDVGLVTFGDPAAVVLQPTPDLAQVRSTVDALTTDGDTALNDATLLAVRSLPAEGVRNILLLTDGRDEGSDATLDQATAALREAEVNLTAVSFGTDAEQVAALQALADAGQGGVVATEQADELTSAFEQAAREIGNQVVVDVTVPEELRGESGNLTVSATAGGAQISASAFTNLPALAVAADPVDRPSYVTRSAPLLDRSVLFGALAALFLALCVVIAIALGAATRSQRREEKVKRRLAIYTLTGRQPKKRVEESTGLGSSAVARSAVELAGRVVEKRDLEAVLGTRLEAAGLPLRPPEWLLVHVGAAIGLALVLFLLSGGGMLATLLGLLFGLVLPWLFLSFKQSRRESAFLAALPDTLQLMAGGLQAGYSMPQAVDTVVREGRPPMSTEFNRALVEARLGVPIEDAMDGIAARIRSEDFSWVVMAIRIQREVGGNLAEVLSTVADTLRERERLRRQVKTLSAEGRLSAWILGALPVVFALYLTLTQPEYLRPLVTDILGVMILVVGVVQLLVGIVWLRKVVKVEV